VLIGAFFWLVMRLILRADRTERRVYQQIENEERTKAGLPLRDDS
jgi:flagellar biogenesis protein FliO